MTLNNKRESRAKLFDLAIYLKKNGHNNYSKEIVRLANIIIPDHTAETREEALSRINPKDADINTVHTVLDIIGLVPGVGEPADFANALLYLFREKYWDAALSVVALAPVVGVVATIAKGKGKKEAIKLIAEKAQEAGLSGEAIRKNFDPIAAEFKAVCERLDLELGLDLQRNGSLDGVLEHYNDIIKGIERYKARGLEVGQRAINSSFKNLRSNWDYVNKAISKSNPQWVNTFVLKTSSKALGRSGLGSRASSKIKSLFPDLSPEEYSAINERVLADISKIKITYIDNVKDAVDRWGQNALKNEASFTMGRNLITVNVPLIGATAKTLPEMSRVLYGAIYHEVGHALDDIIGKAYHEVKGIGRYKGKDPSGNLVRTRYQSKYTPDPHKVGGPFIPMIDFSHSAIKGTRVADALNKAVASGIFKGNDYLIDAGELMTRIRSLKAAARNDVGLKLFDLFKDDPVFQKPSYRPIINALFKASTEKSPENLLFAVKYLKVLSPEKWSRVSRSIDNGGDISDLSKMLNIQGLSQRLGDLKELIDAV